MRRALVTGGTRGIGAAIADRLEADGCEVIRWGRANYDFSNPDELSSAGNFITELGVDILINCAGHQAFGSWSTTPIDIQTMLYAPHCFSMAVSIHMQSLGWGRIINISSIAAIAGGRNCIGYDLAKAGLNRLTKALAVDFGEYGITVNAVMPGFIDTDMLKPLAENGPHAQEIMGRIPIHRFGRPDEVATLVSFLCSDNASYINGAIIPVDGGWLCR